MVSLMDFSTLNELALFVETGSELWFPGRHIREHHGLIVAEEAGEVARAVLKQAQGIRGPREYWDHEIAKEMAGTICAVAGLAGHCGIDLANAVRNEVARLTAGYDSSFRPAHSDGKP